MRLLLNDLAVRGWVGLGFLWIIRGDEFISYISKAMLERTGEEGVRLYGSEKAFNSYTKEFGEFQKEFIDVCDMLLSGEVFEKENLQTFINYFGKCIDYYKYTEFVYLDEAYRELQRGDNPVLKENLKRYETLKFEYRDFINTIFLGKESYYIRGFAKLASQFSLDLDDIQQYTAKELPQLFDGVRVDQNTIRERFLCNIALEEDGEYHVYWGTKAKELIDEFYGDEDVTEEIQGTIVFRGNIRGRVVLLRPQWNEDQTSIQEEMEKMEQGDILVTETTSPDLMLAIKKAGAIVTDQGGLMSHAAIMSRELKVPGIVGAGNATKLLKTGDVVEVDAERGVVTILDD